MTRLAKNWVTVPEQATCVTPDSVEKLLAEPVIVNPEEERAIPIDAAPCGNVQFLEHLHLKVKMTIAHSHISLFHFQVSLGTFSKRGDLTVILRSPSGTTSVLLGARPFDDIRTGLGLFKKWPMMSVHFWGEPVVKDVRGNCC